MMTVSNLTDLLLKHLQGDLTEAEQELLDQWVAGSDRNRQLFASIQDEEQLRREILSFYEEEEENNEQIILSKILAQTRTTPVRRIRPWKRWTAAAAILLLAGTAAYLLLNNEGSSTEQVAATEILPGKNGAVLTLADGSQVVLDSLGNGLIANQSGTQLMLKNGELAYNAGESSSTVAYNNLTTPKGRQFQLVLPDGTKVWLNAASSLRYPTAFTGDKREVSVKGEVYFEVARHAAQPFIIDVDNQASIQVLGTSFNVNAYANESAIRTTLVDGSVKVTTTAGGKSVILQPGQQAQLNTGSQAFNVLNDADIDKAIAWKSGIFNFNNSSLEEVMRQVERWYDIDVVYGKNIPDIRFGGKLSNDVSLSGLLQSLKESEVHFRIEGRKLIVLP